MAAIGDEDLTFTAGEAADALAEVGKGEADAASVVEATGGWVTGVLFEAWRSAEHVPGMGGEADPLHGYLSAQMLAELRPEDRDFLIETAVLHEVSPARVAALGRADAGERLVVAARRPPAGGVDAGPAGDALPSALPRVPRRAARAPAGRRRSGRCGSPTGGCWPTRACTRRPPRSCCSAGAPAEAFHSARRAIFAVIERVDYPTAERWFATLDGVAPRGAYDWVEAQLLLAFTRLDYAREPADQRPAPGERGEREAFAAASERAAALMAWNYLDVARIEDSKAVLAVAPRRARRSPPCATAPG